MKRLLLVMGIVGGGGGGAAPPAGEAALPATPNDSQAMVDESPVQTVDVSEVIDRGGLTYVVNSETAIHWGRGPQT